MTISYDNDEEIERINRGKLIEMIKRKGLQDETKRVPAPPAAGVIDLDDSNFSQISAYPISVVDFWAPWCGPCRMVAPTIKELAREYSGRVTFGRLNVDDNPITSSRFQIQSIPTIMIFKQGQPVDGLLGAVPKAYIEARIRPHLDSPESTSR